MASYPGTVKVWEPKTDITDTVFAAHVNQLQDEMFAVQTALGLNPQGGAQTVGLRLTALENSVSAIANAEEPGTIEGNKTFAGPVTFNDTVAFVGGTPITTVETSTAPVRIGALSGNNAVLDGNTIQARNLTAPADLRLNPYGGNVYVGGNRILTQGDTGAGNNLNADKLDGHDSSYFAEAGHKHAQNFVQVWRSVSLSIPDGSETEQWYDVVFNQTTVHVKESGTDMYTLGNGRFYTPPAVGPALYYFGVRLCFQKTTNVGKRMLRFIDSNGAVLDMMAEEANLMSLDFISLSGMYYFTGESNYWVKAQVFQNSGEAVSIYPNTTVRPFQATWAVMSRRLS